MAFADEHALQRGHKVMFVGRWEGFTLPTGMGFDQGAIHAVVQGRAAVQFEDSIALHAGGAAGLPVVSEQILANLGMGFVDLNQYALPFVLSGVLILLAMVGAIWVARERHPAEVLAELLNATIGLHRTETPLEVDLGGLTFVGVFVETDPGSRLFLAAADGWALIVQGPVEDWPGLAAGLNQVLTSLSFQEGF